MILNQGALSNISFAQLTGQYLGTTTRLPHCPTSLVGLLISSHFSFIIYEIRTNTLSPIYFHHLLHEAIVSNE